MATSKKIAELEIPRVVRMRFDEGCKTGLLVATGTKWHSIIWVDASGLTIDQQPIKAKMTNLANDVKKTTKQLIDAAKKFGITKTAGAFIGIKAAIEPPRAPKSKGINDETVAAAKRVIKEKKDESRAKVATKRVAKIPAVDLDPLAKAITKATKVKLELTTTSVLLKLDKVSIYLRPRKGNTVWLCARGANMTKALKCLKHDDVTESDTVFYAKGVAFDATCDFIAKAHKTIGAKA